MIYSMTAFARHETQQPWGAVTWEIRSVNHRYLEPSFKLPDAGRALEPQLRELLRKHLERGKVEVALRIRPAEGGSIAALKLDQARQVVQAAGQVASLMVNPAPLSPLDVLRWPGVLEEAELDSEAMTRDAVEAFSLALQQLVESRAREGEALARLLLDRLDAMVLVAAQVREAVPKIIDNQRNRLLNRLAELRAELDQGRLEQELVYIAQRADVEEELDRLNTHIAEVRRVLKKGGACGRRLDFLMQELNREANTLASKSMAADTTQAAVDLKVLIEQMREQVQNIE